MDWLSIREFMIDSVKFVATIIIFLVLFLYVVSVTQVVGSSMAGTLENQEVLILNKAKYHLFDVERGDIISFAYADTKYLIKRVIGMPGDTVKVIDNKLYINDQLYDEEYLSDGVVTNDFSLMELGYEKIPEDKYLVLGDNRENSLDSREIGLVNEKDIIGKISFRIWPLNKVGFPR